MQPNKQTFSRRSRYAAPALAAAILVPLGMANADPPQPAPPPVLVSGRILTPALNIVLQPTFKIALFLHGDTTGAQITVTDNSGKQTNFYSQAGQPSGRRIFEFSSSPYTYTPGGTFTIASIQVCGHAGCNTYSGSTLTPLFPSLTIKVSNTRADVTNPILTAGTITTPTAMASEHTRLALSLTLQDDSSGVIDASVTFGVGRIGGTSFVVGGALAHSIKASETYPIITFCTCRRFAAGTYNASSIFLRDRAGNVATITDPATISSLFGGQPAITLTK